jgi:hypothetical protein
MTRIEKWPSTWKSANDRERQRLLEWTYEQLFELSHKRLPVTNINGETVYEEVIEPPDPIYDELVEHYQKEIDRFPRAEIAAAEQGDVSLLVTVLQEAVRQKFGDDYPDISRYISAPKRSRGRPQGTTRVPSPNRDYEELDSSYGRFAIPYVEAERSLEIHLVKAQRAAAEVDFIMALWRKTWPGSEYGMETRAIEIAALAWGLKKEEVERERTNRKRQERKQKDADEK